MLFCPGMEPLGYTEGLLSLEPIENTAFQKTGFLLNKIGDGLKFFKGKT